MTNCKAFDLADTFFLQTSFEQCKGRLQGNAMLKISCSPMRVCLDNARMQPKVAAVLALIEVRAKQYCLTRTRCRSFQIQSLSHRRRTHTLKSSVFDPDMSANTLRARKRGFGYKSCDGELV